jgi:hypothetical protein
MSSSYNLVLVLFLVATLSQSLVVCTLPFATCSYSIVSFPLPLKVYDPCDEFIEHFPQLPIEYLIPLFVGAKRPPFPSNFIQVKLFIS